jgi:hypothetical protein
MKYVSLIAFCLICSCADGADITTKDKFVAQCVSETLEVKTKATSDEKNEIIRDCRILANRLEK